MIILIKVAGVFSAENSSEPVKHSLDINFSTEKYEVV